MEEFENVALDLEQTKFGLSPGDKGSYVLLFIKGILMVAAIALVCSSKEISMGDPCELKEALELISLNYAPFCKYNATIEKSGDVYEWGIAVLVGHSIVFLFILSTCLWPSENKRLGFLIIYILVTVVAFILMTLIFIQYNNVEDARKIPEYKVDFRLEKEMLSSLNKHFTSDSTSSSDEISSNWNIFFIKYECCAVREVEGTTNDFDTTPWCTTSGSCQSTASQIPKTCCKDVTQDDYQNASSDCHASVNPGTYKQSCFNQMKTLSVVNIDEFLVPIASISLFTLVAMQIFEVIATLVVAVFVIVDYVRIRKQTTRENQTTPDKNKII